MQSDNSRHCPPNTQSNLLHHALTEEIIGPPPRIYSVPKYTTDQPKKTPPILVPGVLLRINQFIPSILPIAKSTFWAGVKTGKYPKPIKLSERVTCWRSEDILAVCDGSYQSDA